MAGAEDELPRLRPAPEPAHAEAGAAGREARSELPAGGRLPRRRLALAGDRALWAVFDALGANTVVNYTVYVIAGRAGTRDRVVYRFADEVEKDDDGYAPPPRRRHGR